MIPVSQRRLDNPLSHYSVHRRDEPRPQVLSLVEPCCRPGLA
ncbi:MULTISPECIES: hypothetical protein [unclassified Phenylobacterium]|nr:MULTISPECIES: hypothetical protein [unclassified Phenylobacterium]